jgi:hypothetical protein
MGGSIRRAFSPLVKKKFPIQPANPERLCWGVIDTVLPAICCAAMVRTEPNIRVSYGAAIGRSGGVIFGSTQPSPANPVVTLLSRLPLGCKSTFKLIMQILFAPPDSISARR